MNKETSQISIIMATYNRAHLIERSLTSIQNQTFKDWECIIVDDGSTDHTSKILDSIIAEDHRFKYIKRNASHHKGLSGCRNLGIELAKGDCVIFFDDDDLVHPQNLEVSFAALRKSDLDFCNYQKKPFYTEIPEMPLVEEESACKHFGKEDIENFVSGKRAMASCTVLWKKECFQNIRFNEDLHYAEEWECYGRILLAGFEGITIDEVLYFNRKHPGSNTGRFDSGIKKENESMLHATGLMIAHLAHAEQLTSELEKFFVRLAFRLKSYALLQKLFKYTQPGLFERMKYWSGFKLYPLIRPIFKIKAKI